MLIGAETNDRPYIDYEIQQSSKIGNGLLAIYIHNIKNQSGMIDAKGKNPFDYWYKTINGQKIYFNQLYFTYDWVLNIQEAQDTVISKVVLHQFLLM